MEIDIAQLIQSLADKAPWLVVALSVIGLLRVIFKPLMSIVQAITQYTKTTADDEWLEKFQDSKIYATIVWLLDFLASIKVGAVKNAVKK